MCLVWDCIPAESLDEKNSNPNEGLSFMNLHYLPRGNARGVTPPLRTNSLVEEKIE